MTSGAAGQGTDDYAIPLQIAANRRIFVARRHERPDRRARSSHRGRTYHADRAHL